MITCIGVLVPSAMRYHLGWLAGSNNSAAGLSQLLRLLAVTAAAIFSTAYVYLSQWRMRRDHVHGRYCPSGSGPCRQLLSMVIPT